MMVDEEFLDEIVEAGPTVKLLGDSLQRFDLIEGSKRHRHFIQSLSASRKLDL
jgi:hypothetical protein